MDEELTAEELVDRMGVGDRLSIQRKARPRLRDEYWYTDSEWEKKSSGKRYDNVATPGVKGALGRQELIGLVEAAMAAGAHVVLTHNRPITNNEELKARLEAENARIQREHGVSILPEEPTLRQRVLDGAAKAVLQDRNNTYGSPEQSFKRIAAYWSILFGIDVEPWQVAEALILLKVTRIDSSPQHLDNWVDTAGYAACGAELALDVPA